MSLRNRGRRVSSFRVYTVCTRADWSRLVIIHKPKVCHSRRRFRHDAGSPTEMPLSSASRVSRARSRKYNNEIFAGLALSVMPLSVLSAPSISFYELAIAHSSSSAVSCIRFRFPGRSRPAFSLGGESDIKYIRGDRKRDV